MNVTDNKNIFSNYLHIPSIKCIKYQTNQSYVIIIISVGWCIPDLTIRSDHRGVRCEVSVVLILFTLDGCKLVEPVDGLSISDLLQFVQVFPPNRQQFLEERIVLEFIEGEV